MLARLCSQTNTHTQNQKIENLYTGTTTITTTIILNCNNWWYQNYLIENIWKWTTRIWKRVYTRAIARSYCSCDYKWCVVCQIFVPLIGARAQLTVFTLYLKSSFVVLSVCVCVAACVHSFLSVHVCRYVNHFCFFSLCQCVLYRVHSCAISFLFYDVLWVSCKSFVLSNGSIKCSKNHLMI